MKLLPLVLLCIRDHGVLDYCDVPAATSWLLSVAISDPALPDVDNLADGVAVAIDARSGAN